MGQHVVMSILTCTRARKCGRAAGRGVQYRNPATRRLRSAATWPSCSAQECPSGCGTRQPYSGGVRIRIEGSDLPGRRGGAEADALRRNNVQVGVQCRAEVVDRFPADAESATWEFEVSSREVDGLLDVGGPYVHGRPGARFLYLS